MLGYKILCTYPYLFHRKFNIITNHKPKDPNSNLIRGRLKLDKYDCNIIYKKGRCNLFRSEIHTKESCWEQLDKILTSVNIKISVTISYD